jgi:hypothetical protein
LVVNTSIDENVAVFLFGGLETKLFFVRTLFVDDLVFVVNGFVV